LIYYIFLPASSPKLTSNPPHLKPRSKGIEALPYHAKSPLQDRVDNLNAFRESTDQLLVCTDLASRGLDIPDVQTVVQLQMAGNVVAHLHRMGRCGRGGKKGVGIVYYGSQERELVSVIRLAEKEQGSLQVEMDVEVDAEEGEGKGKIDAAFSRKRGFRKKRKKAEKENQ
jgi:superfamily II DNA/RNA helicase